VARAELLERYRALPMPTTSDESWRFTDLKGFDPDAFVQNGHFRGAVPQTMLDIDVAGLATVGAGVEIERAPAGIRFELLDESHPQLGELVGADEKFAAQNAAEWKHGLLVHVPKGVVLERPLYMRIANPPDGSALFWRLLVIAEPGSRFSLIEDLSAADPELAGYSNAVVDGLLTSARRASDLSRRVELYRRAEQAILDDAPIVPVFHHTYERLFQPYVRSVEVNGLGDPYIPFKKIWLERTP